MVSFSETVNTYNVLQTNITTITTNKTQYKIHKKWSVIVLYNTKTHVYHQQHLWPYGVIHSFITLLIYSLRNNWVTLTERLRLTAHLVAYLDTM